MLYKIFSKAYICNQQAARSYLIKPHDQDEARLLLGLECLIISLDLFFLPFELKQCFFYGRTTNTSINVRQFSCISSKITLLCLEVVLSQPQITMFKVSYILSALLKLT